VGPFASLALDSDGFVHICYYDATNDHLKYATNSSGTWETEDADDTGQVGMHSSIAMDSSNKVHISYLGVGGLAYATNAAGSWEIEEVAPGQAVGEYSSITLDSDGFVHISYYDATDSELKYATNASGDWVSVTVDETGGVCLHSSIALDSSGSVHISYCHSTIDGLKLKHATNASDDGDWVTETVDFTDGEYTSIALDSDDFVHISYYANDNLKYANNACIDNDGDDFGNSGHPACPKGEQTDCDDENENVYPGATEDCANGIDDDCDGLVDLEDEDCICRDNAGDGYGDPGHRECALSSSRDCDDDPSDDPGICEGDGCTCGETDCAPCARCINPGVVEEGYGDPICSDGLDNNCNIEIDSADPGCCECIDNDVDGFGSPPCRHCPDARGDCDDTDPEVNPGATEILKNGKDDDCNQGTPDSMSYPATANTIAASFGRNSLVGSGVCNSLILLLVPVGAIIFMRIRRRSKRTPLR